MNIANMAIILSSLVLCFPPYRWYGCWQVMSTPPVYRKEMWVTVGFMSSAWSLYAEFHLLSAPCCFLDDTTLELRGVVTYHPCLCYSFLWVVLTDSLMVQWTLSSMHSVRMHNQFEWGWRVCNTTVIHHYHLRSITRWHTMEYYLAKPWHWYMKNVVYLC